MCLGPKLLCKWCKTPTLPRVFWLTAPLTELNVMWSFSSDWWYAALSHRQHEFDRTRLLTCCTFKSLLLLRIKRGSSRRIINSDSPRWSSGLVLNLVVIHPLLITVQTFSRQIRMNLNLDVWTHDKDMPTWAAPFFFFSVLWRRRTWMSMKTPSGRLNAEQIWMEISFDCWVMTSALVTQLVSHFGCSSEDTKGVYGNTACVFTSLES